MGLVGASLVAIKLFNQELKYIAVCFVTFGLSMFGIDMFRRHSLKNFRYDPKLINRPSGNRIGDSAAASEAPFLGHFLTSGTFVLLAGLSAIFSYSSIIYIIWSHQ
ncbi:hypothetical protein DSO57_1000735 [Entomophthora muscae]|nr:hypothetical protein DSO57_1000735 [Entomophthora muscae]